ncbi:MAG TPA: pyridoxal-phosphate dependent enzyme [Myxococcota bacterium]|nr:pyridoxal-phosphate dependent enzyme [Myxococcota bacterium]
MGPPEPPLFRRFPALAGRLPHRRYVEGPTPVEPLALEGLGGVELWVKRDDRSCPLYGGNKPRKLEFVIGRALERGARRLVTTGGLGTNHGLATTILGRAAGLATTLVLVDQPVTPKVRESLLLMRAHGAELVHGRGVAGAALGVLATLARGWLRGEKPYLVPTGGSSALGTLGFVGAALELAEQVRAGACPEPAELYVAVGSGGTLAGLVLGLRLAGLRTRAVGVLVTDVLPPSPARLARLARASLGWLRRLDASVPDLQLGPQDFALASRQLGPGYGATTPAAEAALRAAAGAGLSLETTYTAKCLAEILARAREGAPAAGPWLFWNTYNGVDVAGRAPRRASVAELPRSIQALLAGCRSASPPGTGAG